MWERTLRLGMDFMDGRVKGTAETLLNPERLKSKITRRGKRETLLDPERLRENKEREV